MTSKNRARPLGRSTMVFIDFFIACAALMAAYIARFEGGIPGQHFRQLLVLLPAIAIIRVMVNWRLGLYRVVWRYMALRDALQVLISIGAVSLVLALVRFTLYQAADFLMMSFGIIFIDMCLCAFGMVAVRFLPRIIEERRAHKVRGGELALIIGATDTGTTIAREALKNDELEINPIGFIDDNPERRDMKVHGIPILGTRGNLVDVIRKMGATEVIVADSALSSKEVWEVLDKCSETGARVRTAAQPFQLRSKRSTGGQQSKTSLREIRIEDILNRQPIPPSLTMDDLADVYRGDCIMVTGAGGSIGSELCRQLAQLEPSQLILVERDETNLFEIGRELSKSFGPIVVQMLADITDEEHMDAIFKKHKPDSVFHAAAYKHVPLMEKFPMHAVHNNIGGTRNVAMLADKYQSKRFVLVSTDKAVRPTSIMGATKRIAEMTVRELASKSDVDFSCVRFGNVLGSRGSVVGIFRDQIRKGGPVTVTHRDATRYFMTIPEAANLVIQAGTLGGNGDVFMLDMGAPVRILDLAKQMIRLSGASEDTVEIKITGIRPGEKLFEELQADNETMANTKLRKVMHAKVDTSPFDVEQFLEKLVFVKNNNPKGLRDAIKDLQIGYHSGPGEGAGADLKV